jgi:septal ring factor EnvC (AmiA/AmiB activator)
VHAVGDGRVVYADWLRGFGNLLILDHGQGYMSLYAYNEGLLRKVGETVRGGEAVAEVGATGASAESGLYFELRRDGKPFDPMRWVAQ